jgi:PAS domain S-box-containing protein
MDEEIRKEFTGVIFKNIHDGVLILDREYRIRAVNNAFQKWSDRPLSELVDRNCEEVFHDKHWLCPHCTAKVVFETAQMNIETQKTINGETVSYAELSAYPVIRGGGEVSECILFIQDITDRMLCHDEVLRLYNEVAQTKEYLEGIIEHSADAIVSSDLDGIITSWNRGAERIYGFAKEEVLGKYLPFVPDFLIDQERENTRMVGSGEVLKRIETFRQRKDGTIISVSLSLSPIKNAVGEVIGISGVSRDISEKKHVEKELVRRNQELSRLFFISSAMRSTLELERLLRMVLTAVTMGDGLGFNRAILFLVDEKKNILKGAMGVGPASHEEAFHIWDRLSTERKTLQDIMSEIESGESTKDSFFDRLSQGIQIPIAEDTILTKTIKNKESFIVDDVGREPLSDTVLIQQLGTHSYAVVPLLSRDKVIGALWVDNYFNRRHIGEEDMRFLTAFSNHVSSAIENARLFEQVKLTEQELENIFESISDLVYFVTKDYVVKNINKAVVKRLGRPPEEIIGKKCYEVFHGMNKPWPECPHHKAIERKEAFVEELTDQYLGGTFITSSSPIFDMNGDFIGTVNVVSDITELKTLRERVIKTDRLAALGEVAARVAHEIRNPLVSLGGFARRLEQKLEGNMKEYADIIAKEVRRLESFLNEILGFVKETRIMKEPVENNKLMTDVVSLVDSEIDDKGIVLVKEFGNPVELLVDPNRIKDALLNILKNAVQAITGKGTITVRTYTKNSTCIFEIQDTGPGIPEAELRFIFDPFFTTKQSGTGLGLTITHRIIEEHAGTIEVESRKGEGSIFRVLLPIKP